MAKQWWLYVNKNLSIIEFDERTSRRSDAEDVIGGESGRRADIKKPKGFLLTQPVHVGLFDVTT